MRPRVKIRTIVRKSAILSSLGLALLMASVFSTGAAALEEPTFLYSLSNFNGPVPCTWAAISVDRAHNEIYVVDGGEVIVFNDVGMEIYRFGEGGGLGMILDVAVNAAGDILIISRIGSAHSIWVCNFRGEPQSELRLTDLPAEFSGFTPRRVVYRSGRLYLLDPTALKIVVTDENGRFQAGYDVGADLEIRDERRGASEIDGFSVDVNGNMLFTIPVRFTAYRLAPDGTLTGFGRPGSGPGHFNLVAGIVADEYGNYYVADRLKSVVQVFDSNFQYQMAFGHRGARAYNLFGPKQMALDARGRLYVSQLRDRGVSVFRISSSDP